MSDKKSLHRIMELCHDMVSNLICNTESASEFIAKSELGIYQQFHICQKIKIMESRKDTENIYFMPHY